MPATMNRPQSSIVQLTEETMQSSGVVVDRANGLIKNVKLGGRVSRNEGGQREYSDPAFSQLVKHYRGAKVNYDHPPDRSNPGKVRDTKDAAGWIGEDVVEKPDGAYGTLHVIKSHPMANALFEIAERNPRRLGLSHNAEGEVHTAPDGRRVVSNITKFRSLDIVQDPATVQGLFESLSPSFSNAKGNKMPSLMLNFDESFTQGQRSSPFLESADTGMGMGYGKPIAGLDEDDDEQDDETDASASPDPALLALAHKITDNANLSVGEKIAKLKTLLTAHAKTFAKPAPAADPVEEDDDDDSSMAESFFSDTFTIPTLKLDLPKTSRRSRQPAERQLTPAALLEAADGGLYRKLPVDYSSPESLLRAASRPW